MAKNQAPPMNSYKKASQQSIPQRSAPVPERAQAAAAPAEERKIHGSEGLNRVLLLGNLGGDPELIYGKDSGAPVLKFSVATNERYFDKKTNERKDRTDWHNIVIFGKRAEALEKILSKGSSVFVEGRIETSSYEKDGVKTWRTNIIANNLILNGRGPARGGEDTSFDTSQYE